ncbi:MAG: Gfo/Idh/MocA family oxidoreductase [Clostridia bacterium]|nr:Gfo/Idh/MocA family oxidoreductase [Clostridia bacterium]
MKIGIIGCGNISGIYLKNLSTLFKNTEIYAVSDLDPTKAENAKNTYNIPHIMTVDEMLECREIELILNITTPPFHYSICKQILLANKHAYVEKPLSLTYAQGKELIELAEQKGLYFGCAPDTFLGAGIQTCKKLIDEGRIGNVIGGEGFMMCRGHESWHPAPEFYYDVGGGPLFDMGPYYLTALVTLLGKVKSVFAYASKSFTERTITSAPKYGTKIPVKVDTHIVGLLKFECGATITLTTSFDVLKHTMPNIELYGTEGSLLVPDPNTFGGPVKISTVANKEFTDVKLISPYSANSRGIGLSETIVAIGENRLNNASGKLALHVLEIMESFITSSNEHREITLESSPPVLCELDWSVNLGEIKTK